MNARMDLRGEYHDATRVCVDGFACYVAAIVDGSHVVNMHECESAVEARAWCVAELKRRGLDGAPIRDTTTEAGRYARAAYERSKLA